MSETVQASAKNKEGEVLAEFELELPTDFEELEILPGKEKVLTMVRNQMKIEARRGYKPGASRLGALPKAAQTELRDAISTGIISVEELTEFVKAKKMLGEDSA